MAGNGLREVFKGLIAVACAATVFFLALADVPVQGDEGPVVQGAASRP